MSPISGFIKKELSELTTLVGAFMIPPTSEVV
jgi:hypothetical protein